MFTLYYADVTGSPANCRYPHEIEVNSAEDLKKALKKDYVCAKYKGSYRSGENFISADCLPVDCDNDHSEDPKDWVTPEDVAKAFPGVRFAVHYSRNHMKEKNGKAARPKFHILFPIAPVTDPVYYSDTKKLCSAIFPYFDKNALDSARFFFGTPDPDISIHYGNLDLSEYLGKSGDKEEKHPHAIYEGSRNSTMSRYAARLIKRLGDNDEAYKAFLEESKKCLPPLDNTELDSIWRSARNFYSRISASPDYVPPEDYQGRGFSLEPVDYSDVGQARILSREYADRIRYSPSTDYLVYNGSFWEESAPKAQGIAQALTERQLKEAENKMESSLKVMNDTGASVIFSGMSKAKAQQVLNPEQLKAYKAYEHSDSYRNYVVKRRDSKYISAALKELRPMIEIDQEELDKNEFMLNTPSATYDLRWGTDLPHAHNAEDFITKQTAVDPSGKGADIWDSALSTFFCDNHELIRFAQEVTGLAAIGKVYLESLIIAYGDGKNGKSTFWNTVSRVMGTYSGNFSADTLTVGCKRNIKPELAEAKGKRLIIAAELEEGMRLSTSNLKQLCSTDEIFAEKKYKAPFSFIPSHTLILYTNHLPKVGAIDKGTWRRLIVIPFTARIDGESDIKNYGDYLFENCGEAVLKWIMEGAMRVIANSFRIELPEVVRQAVKSFRDNNDWLSHFLEECCDLGDNLTEKSGKVYTAYRTFCFGTGDYVRSTSDFYSAIDSYGFERKRTNSGVIISGLKLKTGFSS